jgi:hypothetical protein
MWKKSRKTEQEVNAKPQATVSRMNTGHITGSLCPIRSAIACGFAFASSLS